MKLLEIWIDPDDKSFANDLLSSHNLVAANLVAKWIKTYKWIGWAGLIAILVVALDLIYSDIKVFI